MKNYQRLKTATILCALLITPITANAEIIVGIDDPINPGNTINTDITDLSGNPVDIHTISPSTNFAVGYNSTANLLINNESNLSALGVYIGRLPTANGTVNIQGPNTKWTTAGIQIGDEGQGTLNIKNGASIETAHAHLGYHPSANGTVNIQDSNSKWTISHLNVGFLGQGTLNIKNGALIETSHAHIRNNSTVNMQDQNSKWTTSFLNVGTYGQGTLNIKKGASAIADHFSISLSESTTANGIVNLQDANSKIIAERLNIGEKSQGTLNVKNGANLYSDFTRISNGILNIQGPNSSSTGRKVSIGIDGQGTLNIKNGATATIRYADIGSGDISFYNQKSDGTVNIQDTGSNLTTIGTQIGTQRQGTLNIKNGATANTKIAIIGYGSTASGTVNIQNMNSRWTILDTLTIAQEGQGTLNIKNGATTITYDTIIGNKSTANGAVNIQDINTKWTNLGTLTVAQEGQAELNIKNGATVSTSDAIIGNDSTANGTANIQDTNSKWSITNKLTLNHGKLNIKNGATLNARKLSITGLLRGQDPDTTNLSTLNLSLSSTEDPFINVYDHAKIAGILNILTNDLQSISYNDTFTLINIDRTRTGQFRNLNEGDTAATAFGYDLILTYQGGDGNDITLTAIPEPTTLLTLLTLAPLTLTRKRKHKN